MRTRKAVSRIAALLIALAMALTLAACSGGTADEPVSLENCPVSRDTSFGGVYIQIPIEEFNELGFAFGDSVDIEFSNGYEIRSIPYFNGYYVRVGEPLLVGYPGYPYVEAAINCGDPLWDSAGLSESDTATVSLVEHSAFLDTQEAFDITYPNDRAEYTSDEEFANFRPLAGGSIKPDTVYRSASPIDDEYGRAGYVEALMEKAGVAFVLDLSDNNDEIAKFMAESAAQDVELAYFSSLLDADAVAALDLSAAYPTQSYAQRLAAGFVRMSSHDGPYLIHCIEGKDRTGFASILLEALAGASYNEMRDDYMQTYANYYKITRDSDPAKYDAIVSLNFNGMLSFLAGEDDEAKLGQLSYVEPARAYLRSGGMTDEQIDALVARLVS